MEEIQRRVDEMNLPEDWRLELIRSRGLTSFVFSFEFPGTPGVDEVDRYMHLNYAVVMPSQVPGLVQCSDREETHHFLDLVEAHEGPISYEKVLKFAWMVNGQGWYDAIYPYVGEWIDKLPAEGSGAPYWWDEDEFSGAELVTTVGETNVHGSHHNIPQPKDTALLVAILAHDVGGESEVEWFHCMEMVGIEGGSLEEFLALQLVCHNDTPYAYIRVDLIGGIWLLAVPENLEFLEAATTSKGFQDYYSNREWVYDGNQYEGHYVNPREEAIKAWLDAVNVPIEVNPHLLYPEAWELEDVEEEDCGR